MMMRIDDAYKKIINVHLMTKIMFLGTILNVIIHCAFVPVIPMEIIINGDIVFFIFRLRTTRRNVVFSLLLLLLLLLTIGQSVSQSFNPP
jgi:hypothetical protein